MKHINHLINNKDGKHVTWSDSYSMGIQPIDDQHKELLLIVNDLFNNNIKDEATERIYFREVIRQAVQYAKNHFSMEEKYMLATEFPGYAAHKKIHEDFILTVIQTARDFDAGKRLILERFAYYLKDWVLTHVAVVDVVYAQYFRRIAVPKADGYLGIMPLDITISTELTGIYTECRIMPVELKSTMQQY